MAIRLLLGLICVMFSTTSLYAAPAAPDQFDIDQPDGTRFKARIQGDEFQSWVEAVDSGHTVVKSKQNNHWEYAEKNPDGSLRASGVKVSPDGKHVPAFIQKGIKPERDTEREKQHGKMLREMYNRRVPALSSASSDENGISSAPDVSGAPGDWTPAAVSGVRKVLIVLVNFSNRALVTTAANWSSAIFDTTPGVKSVANYYKDNSFNTLTVSPASHTQAGNPQGIVTVTVSDAHPNSGGNYNYASETSILNHALAQAGAYVNYASFDSNGNGSLEQSELSIYFIYAGYEASGSANTPNIWAHAWGGSVTAGSKTVTRWALNGELNNSSVQHPMGVIAHELGHALCGLPDLYDTSNVNAGLGYYSLMAGGSWGRDTGEYSGATPVALDAWSREYLGWTAPVVPGSNGQISLGYSLASANNAVKLINTGVSSSEYWLAENRYAAAGWDRGLRGYLGAGYVGGLLITHIDITSGTQGSNDINKYVAGGHQGVMAEQASTAGCNMAASTCRGSVASLYYSGNNSSFGLATTPSSSYYSGAASDIALNNISAAGATMTVDYTNGVLVGYATDGKPDIFWHQPSTGNTGYYFMNGSTFLSWAQTKSAPVGWNIAALKDFDGDGKVDILWRNPKTGQNCIYFMDGTTFKSYVLIQSAPVGWNVAGVADFNGDGKSDILWHQPSTGTTAVYLMDGSTFLSYTITQSAPVGWSIAALNDFDSDGKVDILWRKPTTGQNCIYFMNGTIFKSYVLIQSAPVGWNIAGVVDFNGDGKPDILWHQPSTGTTAVYLMNGSTFLSYTLTQPAPVGWGIAALKDFDGDGKVDILWRNASTGQNCIYFMDGIIFKNYVLIQSAPVGWSIAGVTN